MNTRRLDRIARQQHQEALKLEAVDRVKRDKAKARREIDRLPFKGATLAVLRALSGYHFHYRGVIRKSLEQIAKKVGVTARTVRRALRELEENGVIECVRTGRGRGVVSTYRVLRYVIRNAAERLRGALKRVRQRLKSRPRKPDICAPKKPDINARAYRVYNTHLDMSRAGGKAEAEYPPPWMFGFDAYEARQ